jgi:uncharacterized protein
MHGMWEDPSQEFPNGSHHMAEQQHPSGLIQECGLDRPRPALCTWPPDTHMAVAMFLALPVWLTLGLFFGPHLRAPVGGLAWASLLLVQPLLEELVFRGLLQGQALALLVRGGKPMRLGPFTLANVLITVAFVALHLRAQPLAWALAVAAPSLVFGHLRERFASVWPAVGMHAFYNAGFAATAWLVTR